MVTFRTIQICTFSKWATKLLPVNSYRTAQSVPRYFSTDENNASQNISRLGSPDFSEVVRSPYYVDKTLFIDAVLRCPAKHMLITAPRRFNKSVNLSMLECFLSSKKYETVFKELKIGKTPSMNLCGEVPVVWLDLQVDKVHSVDDAVEAWRRSIRNAFLSHSYLNTEDSNLSPEEKNLVRIWCDPLEFASLHEVYVKEGLERLCEYVFKYHGRKSMLLVDEFDSFCSSAFPAVDAQLLGQIINFYSGMIGSVLKVNTEYVERGVLTGITRVMSAGNSMSNVSPFRFLEEEYFTDYYGILEDEFDELMERDCNSIVREKKKEAVHHYNGYSAFGKRILNTWSVMNFLSKKVIKSYWVYSGVNELRLEKTCDRPIVRNVVKKLLREENVRVHNNIQFHAESLKTFFESFDDPKKTVTDYGFLLYYYVQMGYLSVSDKSIDRMYVRIPNRELKKVFQSAMLECFQKKYNIELIRMEECVLHLEKLDCRDSAVSRKALESICVILEEMCNDVVYVQHINEAILREFVFSMMYVAGFCPLSETRVHRVHRMKYKYKQVDLCAAIRGNQAIVVECKVDQHDKTAGIAQILNNEYYQGLLNLPSFTQNEIKDFLIIGINLKKNDLEKEVQNHAISACFLCNSLDLRNIVYV